MQRVALDAVQPHEGEAEVVGPVRRASRKEACLPAIEARGLHLGLGHRADVLVEDPQQPHVREVLETLERVRGVERVAAVARRVATELYPQLGGRGADAALPGRACLG